MGIKIFFTHFTDSQGNTKHLITFLFFYDQNVNSVGHASCQERKLVAALQFCF